MIKVSLINGINQEAILKKLNSQIDNASAVLVNEIERVSDPFTPFRTGDLYASVKKEKKGNRYIGISYNVPYAKDIWYGKPYWHYTKTDTHPNAGPRWVERAFDVHKNDVIKIVAERI